MTGFLQDLRFGVRLLRRAPGFTAVAVLTLALGIGANAAMFGVVDALLFRPPAGVGDPGRVVRVQVQAPAPPGEPPEISGVLSYPDYRTLRDRAKGFAAVAAYARTMPTVGRGEEGRTQAAVLVTGNYFRLLGVRAALGRTITPDDDREDAAVPVAVLSWDYWKRAMSGDRSVIGKPIVLNNQSFTVIGVAPRHFVGTELGSPALWLPLGTAPMLGFDARMTRSPYASWLSVVARLARGAARAQAVSSAQAAMLAAREQGDAPPPGAELGGPVMGEVRVQIGPPGGPGGGPARAAPPPRVRLAALGASGAGLPGLPTFGGRGMRQMPVSLWFLAVTAAVLLIACANVANLLLARASARRSETIIRVALGATRSRLVRQLVTESLLLALLGGGAGLILALAGVALLPRAIPLPPLPPFLDARVLAFTALLTLATTVLFTLAPAFRATRTDLNAVLGAAGRQRAARSWGRSALVVVQLATSLVLLVAAGLFVRSLRNVKAVDPGFDVEHTLTAQVDLRGARLTREQSDEFWRRALERVRAAPGVRAAALGGGAPFEMIMVMPVDAPDRSGPTRNPRPAQTDFAGEGYFAALGIPVRQGRAFTAEDRAGSAPVAIINETLARRLWGGESPIGKCLQGGPTGPGAPCYTVVGVVADVRWASVTEEASPMFYTPLAQRPREAPPMTVLHVRAVGQPTAIAAGLRRVLQGVDASVPFVLVRPVAEMIRPQLMPWRTGTLIFTLFGVLGMLLAAVGLYGVLSFLVAQRTRELGVRIALGAQRRDVLALVLAQGGRLIAVGVLVGAAAAAAATRLVASMMYGVSPLDPVVYLGTAVILAVVGLAAVYAPARRATRVDPVVALRAE